MSVEVRALWEQVPAVNCKGLCTQSCGPIAWSDAEDVILGDKGVDFDRATLTCNQLKFGRCAIYDDRPLVCRLWGAVPEMQCPFGCEPTMSSAHGRILMQQMLALPVAPRTESS